MGRVRPGRGSFHGSFEHRQRLGRVPSRTIWLLRRARSTWLLLVGAAVAGCATLPAADPDWPDHAPAQRQFLQVYELDAVNRAVQPREEYLNWVKQFYDGSDIYPLGWAELEQVFLDEFDPPVQARTAEELQRLGGKLAADWAKHNNLRSITSAMLLIWLQVIQEAIESGLGLAALELIEQDVDALLDGRLPPQAVGVERYAAWLPEST